MDIRNYCLTPNWPAPKNVRALQTTRAGGISKPPYNTFNLGDHVGDAPLAVEHNRMLLNPLLPSEPVWMKQVHGTTVVSADMTDCVPQADACIARHHAAVCVVMTADCLPLLLCDKQGSVVGAVHAGWKGLADGIVEAAVQAMDAAPQNLMAWLGPAISQDAFEVGHEVRAAFVNADPHAAAAFIPPRFNEESKGEGKKWFADIYALARLRLNALGITQVYGGSYCTYRERERFYSYRRDGVTGRMGTFIWLE